MDQLIDSIRAATATGATTEQKAAGVQACRTIIAALATEPGTPLVPPPPAAATPIARPSLDQMLDMIIAKLTLIAKDHDASPAPAPAVRRLRVPVTPALPRGTPTRPPAMKRAATRKP